MPCLPFYLCELHACPALNASNVVSAAHSEYGCRAQQAGSREDMHYTVLERLTRARCAGRRRFIFNIIVAIYNMATYYPAIWKCINPYWCDRRRRRAPASSLCLSGVKCRISSAARCLPRAGAWRGAAGVHRGRGGLTAGPPAPQGLPVLCQQRRERLDEVRPFGNAGSGVPVQAPVATCLHVRPHAQTQARPAGPKPL